MIWISILIILVVLLVYIQPNIVEAFSSKNIILLGDSILKNDKYVGKNHNITYILQEQGFQVNCLAKDNAVVENLFTQIGNFKNIDTNASYVISTGGNNILQHRDMDMAFKQYKNFITKLRNYVSQDKIILCTIYYPPTHKHYFSKIKEWNNSLINFAKGKYKLLRIDIFMNNVNDFTNQIEPSYLGSKKIVKHLNNIII